MVLDVRGMEAPDAIRGVPQAALEAVSFAHTFDDAAAPSLRATQYFEMFGHRAIYHDGWRAVCPLADAELRRRRRRPAARWGSRSRRRSWTSATATVGSSIGW